VVARLYAQRATEMLGGAGASGVVGDGAAARGADFGALIGEGLGQLAGMEQVTTTRAAQAATGDLESIHDYVIAAASMQTATELTTTVRNKSLEAFAEIMRMPL
jgi:flagellar hook-basal body complex protein FliE